MHKYICTHRLLIFEGKKTGTQFKVLKAHKKTKIGKKLKKYENFRWKGEFGKKDFLGSAFRRLMTKFLEIHTYILYEHK